MNPTIVTAERMAEDGLRLMRAAGGTDDLLTVARHLAMSASLTEATANREPPGRLRATYMGTARCLAQTAHLLAEVVWEAEEGGELLPELVAVAHLVSEALPQEEEPAPLSLREGTAIQFHCPARSMVVSKGECAKLALRGDGDPCGLDCEMGRLNIRAMGCNNAMQLLGVG